MPVARETAARLPARSRCPKLYAALYAAVWAVRLSQNCDARLLHFEQANLYVDKLIVGVHDALNGLAMLHR